MEEEINNEQPAELPHGVTSAPLVDEVKTAFLDYAMSVIVDRALPDVRDGLKPVHRRILYSMWNSGLRSSAKFRKSATVVGDVLGKYHPHGDSSVYEAMVRMVQEFSLRYPLVRGQGNFGSVDGDSAAAYRYTEAKLSPIAEEMLFDIDKNTVDFRPNYDGSHDEPRVLPGKLPNLVLNGTLGIAVGMATNIPPHNLTEVCNGIIALIENGDLTIEELVAIIPGPDFPTGGIIYDKNAIMQAYATGRGGIVMRAKTEIIEEKAGNFQIIVSELPYQVNKANLLEKMAELVTEKRIEGIRDLRDESNKEGIRMVIDLKKDSYPKKVLNQLFKFTQLQEAFHVNSLCLIDGIQPRILTLKHILEEYISHRKEVVRRRTQYDLDRAKERIHILEGLRIALLHIDEIIATIKKSKDKDEAKSNLMSKFKLSEIQSQAILDMRLQQLANLERLKVEQEWEEKKKIIDELESILASVKKMLNIIKAEVEGLRDKFGDARRTLIIPGPVGEFSMEDLVPQEQCLIMLTDDGYIKRLPPDTFKAQHRGGKGIVGVATKEEDAVRTMFTTNTHTEIMFFTSRGRVFRLKAYELPQATRTSKGQAIVNFLQLAPGEKVTVTLPMDDIDGSKHLVMVTRQGTIKKSGIEEFSNVRRSGLIAITLHESDELVWVKPSSGKDDISLVTREGQSIRFNEDGVRSMGRTAAGVRGITLKGKDYVVAMDVINPKLADKGELALFVITQNGMGKRTDVSEYRAQGRGGSGIRTAKVSAKTGGVVNAYISSKEDERDLVMISKKGIVVRTPFKSVPELSRDTQGVRLMRFKEDGDLVSSVTFVEHGEVTTDEE
ncbi:MAG: DNA gyrase subunit A [Candidatus Magasanikbacteria bacterium]|nr:DNA gyrase subunit A [Candidatus Magasanikbacteria bacterium]MCA9390677.1 DNA gyrase subunit A [Candidatus Magasanikbacteria bacterium]USN52343.1 MAG: DNA gyrase subunit A [Candidatus Nomurabacteria bacterium]